MSATELGAGAPQRRSAPDTAPPDLAPPDLATVNVASSDSAALDAAFVEIAAGAGARDSARAPGFPDDAFNALRVAGALAFNAVAGPARPGFGAELALVRRVAAADGSVGRIFDGHLNAVERIAVQAPADLCDQELAAVRAGELLAGVWGGDPVPAEGEGEPATVVTRGGQPGGDRPREVLTGVKTFCSGAGGLDRALVLARNPEPGPPLSVWIDLTDADHVEIDRGWYHARGLVASESHRVIFRDAPVLARLGPAGAIAEQPWFARDALRTAASWAGMADTAAEAALQSLAERPQHSDLEELAAGRIANARQTIDVWLTTAAETANCQTDMHKLADTALHARVAIAKAARELLDEAARACGSRPFARGQTLDRARRDLELFLLQHRLDPLLVRAGLNCCGRRRGSDDRRGLRAPVPRQS